MASHTVARRKPQMATGTVTFLFSDIEQSTERWESHRDAMKSALKRHDSLVRRAIKSHGGVVFKTIGDAFCAAFSRPESAVEAAIDVQRAVNEQDWRSVDGLRVRVAVHAGTAHLRNDDYFGPTVNRVARVLALAHGGQILITDVVAQLVQNLLPAGVDVLDLGAHKLRGVARPERLHQVLAPDLQAEFPPLVSSGTHPNNLPRSLTSFIGRDQEVERIGSLLSQSPLVTIVGSGGIGKTRCALEVARMLLSGFPDGVWFVDLAPIREPKFVVSALAQVLNVDDTGSQPLIDALLFMCKPKRALIVFDNCEHLLQATSEIVQRLLAQCPQLTILATSREPLCLAAESRYRIPVMSPEDGVALFAARAVSSGAEIDLGERNAAAVEDIVRRVDGIALAIEIAASRVGEFGLTGLAKHLNSCLNLPSRGNRGVAPRQQTVRAVIDWSYGLLDEPERALFRQIGVFSGAMTLDAVMAVCEKPADLPAERWNVLLLLAALVDKSLLVVDIGTEPRYRLLELTREYAIERSDARERNAALARHCRYYATASASACEDVYRMNLGDWLAQTRYDLQNYRAAIEWGLRRKHDIVTGAQIVSNLIYLWWEVLEHEGRSLMREAMAAVDASEHPRLYAELVLGMALVNPLDSDVETCANAISVLAKSPITPVRYADALLMFGRDVLGLHGRLAESAIRLEQALDIALEARCERLAASILRYLSYCYRVAGQNEKSARAIEEAHSIFVRCKDDWRTVEAFLNMAELQFDEGDVAGAIAFAHAGISLGEEAGVQPSAQLLGNIAAYYLASAEFGQAWKWAQDALEQAYSTGANMTVLFALQHLACVSAVNGDMHTAGYVIGYVDGMMQNAKTVRESTERKGYDELMRRLHDALGSEAVAQLQEEGARATRDTVVARAMAIPDPSSHAALVSSRSKLR